MLTWIMRFVASRLYRQEWATLRDAIEALSAAPCVSVPLVVQCMLVSGEDHRHGTHNGYDLRGMARALFRIATGQSIEGASTIEQQLVRVITVRYEYSIRRKAREVLIASLVTRDFPKSLTTILYLRVAYFGAHMNGYAEACRHLALDPENLTSADAAHLIARLKYPEPSKRSDIRRTQIQARAKHLMRLYHDHLAGATYAHLRNTPLSARPCARLSRGNTP